MIRPRLAFVALLLVTLSGSISGCVTVAAAPPPLPPAAAQTQPSTLQVRLSSAQSTISWDSREPDPVKFELPLLYLHRERTPAPPAERTLDIQVTGLAAGETVDLELESRRVDLVTVHRHRERQRFVAPARGCSAAQPCTLRWTLDAAHMPSDFYYLCVYDGTGQLLWRNSNPSQPDFVALDTWDVPLEGYSVRVYYATLFPFARGVNDMDSRLSTGDVADFVGSTFVPIIRETWQTQARDWGWGEPLHPDWDRDKIVEVIITDRDYALFDGTGTYSAWFTPQGEPYPERRIWWLASSNSFLGYDSLADGYRAIFAHEFFHLMQWNVVLWAGQPAGGWHNLFIEAQARLAPTVQYPQLELLAGNGTAGASRYTTAANRYLTQRLNSSYTDMAADPRHLYDLALYWRFLYEQAGEMNVIRSALETLVTQGEEDAINGMGRIMDRVFAARGGPYHSFEESLVAFARANYALRLENGRCSAPDPFQCNGLYFDPDGLYTDPPLEAQLYYDGARLIDPGLVRISPGPELAGVTADDIQYLEDEDGRPAYAGAIPASYGMDFVEIRLAPGLHGRPLTVALQGEGAAARFALQVWKLGPGAIRPRAVTPQPERVPGTGPSNRVHAYTIPSVDTANYNRLALIITRLDPDESADPVGAYHITID